MPDVLSVTLAQGSVCEPVTIHHVKKKDGSVQIGQKLDNFTPTKESEDDTTSPYALVIRRFISEKRETELVTAQINSPLLRKAFQEVVKSYPTVASNFGDSFQLKSPFQILYHYWDDLAVYRDQTDSAHMRQHLNLLFEFMDQEMGTDKRLVDSMISGSMISFKQAWIIYRPGELVYTETMGKPWLMRVQNVSYETSKSRGPYLTIHVKYWDAAEGIIGETETAINIFQKERFPSDHPARIDTLDIYPRRFCSRSHDLENELLARGKKYVANQGILTREYDGLAQYLKEPGLDYFDPRMADYPPVWLPFTETGRIVLDRKTFEEENYNAVKAIHETCKPELMLCPPYLVGYSMDRKIWCRYLIDNLRDVGWKSDAWSSLVLEDEQKRVLKALVTSHHYPENARNHPEQKGKGLVILLHGTPGSGKTLSAETAAEMSRKPLLSTSLSQLMSDGSWYLEYRLEKLLQYATTWKAIVLCDEVDVCLERRQDGSSENTRHTLVAVFLKQLEYFSGIIFLTTNRLKSIDDAMYSRIHLSIHFTSPSIDARRHIWRRCLETVPRDETEIHGQEASQEAIEALIRYDINGREISNALNTARTLARFEGSKFRMSHIETVLQIRKDFANDLR